MMWRCPYKCIYDDPPIFPGVIASYDLENPDQCRVYGYVNVNCSTPVNGVEIKLWRQLHYHAVNICISFFYDDSKIFPGVTGTLLPKKIHIRYRVYGMWTRILQHLKWDWNKTWQHLIIMMWRLAYHCFMTIQNFSRSYGPLWLRKSKSIYGLWFMNVKISSTWNGIEIKLDTFNYHDEKICILFFYDDRLIFPGVIALYDLENPVEYRAYGMRTQMLQHLTGDCNKT